MGTEIWKDAVGYEGKFKVSNEGNVKDVKNKLKTLKDGESTKDDPRNVYKLISFRENGKEKREYVHRMVAKTFIIDHPSERNEIDHKDENRSNNCVGNLQWVTKNENNFLRKERENLRKAIEAMMDEDEALGVEGIKKKLAEKFKNSDIFSFDEQYVIAYGKIVLKKIL